MHLGSYSYLSLRFQGKVLIEHALWAHRQSRLTGSELQASQVPPGLVGGGDLRWGRHRSALGLATPNLDRDRRAEGLTVGVAESEVHLVDFAIGCDMITHGDREGEGSVGVTLDLLTTDVIEEGEGNLARRLLIGESDLGVGLVGLVGVVIDDDRDLLGLSVGELNNLLRLADDECTRFMPLELAFSPLLFSALRAFFALAIGFAAFRAVLSLAGLVLSGSLLGSDVGADVLDSLDHFVFVANVFESSFELLLFSLLISLIYTPIMKITSQQI